MALAVSVLAVYGVIYRIFYYDTPIPIVGDIDCLIGFLTGAAAGRSCVGVALLRLERVALNGDA